MRGHSLKEPVTPEWAEIVGEGNQSRWLRMLRKKSGS